MDFTDSNVLLYGYFFFQAEFESLQALDSLSQGLGYALKGTKFIAY